ncbi:hypothetical protein ACTA71_000749 [Dictyostelium dimigraforme]
MKMLKHTHRLFNNQLIISNCGSLNKYRSFSVKLTENKEEKGEKRELEEKINEKEDSIKLTQNKQQQQQQPILKNPIIFKSPFQIQQSIINNNNNNNNNNNHNNEQKEKEDYNNKKEREEEEKEYEEKEKEKGKRILRIFYFITAVSFTYYFSSYETNYNNPTELIDEVSFNGSFVNRFSKEDYDIISKKLIYQLSDKDAYRLIYQIFKNSEFSRQRLIESGIYQYCIDYLMEHHSNENGQLNNNNNNNKSNRSKIIMESERDYNGIKIRKLTFYAIDMIPLYKIIIGLTIIYNNLNKLPEIQLPQELNDLKSLKHLNIRLLGYNNGTIPNCQDIKESILKQFAGINFLISFSFGVCYQFIANRKSMKSPLFKRALIVTSGISCGLLAITSEGYYQQLYDQDIKKSIRKNPLSSFITYLDPHLNKSWFLVSLLALTPILFGCSVIAPIMIYDFVSKQFLKKGRPNKYGSISTYRISIYK